MISDDFVGLSIMEEPEENDKKWGEEPKVQELTLYGNSLPYIERTNIFALFL